jgi:hypothetical protein
MRVRYIWNMGRGQANCTINEFEEPLRQADFYLDHEALESSHYRYLIKDAREQILASHQEQTTASKEKAEQALVKILATPELREKLLAPENKEEWDYLAEGLVLRHIVRSNKVIDFDYALQFYAATSGVLPGVTSPYLVAEHSIVKKDKEEEGRKRKVNDDNYLLHLRLEKDSSQAICGYQFKETDLFGWRKGAFAWHSKERKNCKGCIALIKQMDPDDPLRKEATKSRADLPFTDEQKEQIMAEAKEAIRKVILKGDKLSALELADRLRKAEGPTNDLVRHSVFKACAKRFLSLSPQERIDNLFSTLHEDSHLGLEFYKNIIIKEEGPVEHLAWPTQRELISLYKKSYKPYFASYLSPQVNLIAWLIYTSWPEARRASASYNSEFRNRSERVKRSPVFSSIYYGFDDVAREERENLRR